MNNSNMNNNFNTPLIRYKRGFSFLSFLFGILMGIVLVFGAVAGVAFFALQLNIDKVLDAADLDNSVDEETGRNKIINTDEESGVQTLWELFTRISDMSQNAQNLTLGEIDNLLPASQKLVDSVKAFLDPYIELDYDEIYNVKFSEFAAYLQNTLLDLQPGKLIGAFGVEMNMVLDILLNGVEADYIFADGQNRPLYFEYLTPTDEGYVRVGDSASLPAELSEFVVSENGNFKIYFYQTDKWYVARKSDVYAETTAEYSFYSGEHAVCTGNYYLDANGEKVDEDPISLRTFMEGGAAGAFDRVKITALFNAEEGGIIDEILGDITLGNLLNGEVNFDEKINNLELGKLIEVDLNDDIMLFFAYGLSDMTDNGNGTWSARYKLGDEGAIPVTVTVENGKITAIRDENGVNLKGTTVADIGTLTQKIDIGIFLDVSADNKILSYLAYGITDLQQDENGNWTCVFGEDPCTVEVDENGYITSVQNTVTGGKVEIATIDQLTERVNGVTNDLKIGDIVDVKGNKLLEKLAGYTLSNIGEATDNIAISDVTDIPYDNKIMAYLAFGVTKVNYAGGDTAAAKIKVDGTEYDCVLNLEEGNIVGGYYLDVNADNRRVDLEGTTLKDVSARVDGLTQDLTIGDLVTIGPEDKILSCLADCTISNLDDGVSNLGLGDVIDVEATTIMAYLGYGIKDISLTPGTNSGTAVYADPDGSEQKVYLVTQTNDGRTYIKNVYLDESHERELKSTKVNDVSSKIEGLMSVLKVRDVFDNPEDNVFLNAIKNSPIDGIGDAINKLTVNELYADKIYGVETTDAEGNTITESPAMKKAVSADAGEGERVFDETYLYYTLDQEGGYTMVSVEGNELGKLTRAQFDAGVQAGAVYYTYGRANSLWRLLIEVPVKADGVKTGTTEHAYTITALPDMIGNVTQNINGATIRTLDEAGIVHFDNKEVLEKTLPLYNKPFGDMTLEEALNFIVSTLNSSPLG